jgi:hypothetical protein
VIVGPTTAHCRAACTRIGGARLLACIRLAIAVASPSRISYLITTGAWYPSAILPIVGRRQSRPCAPPRKNLQRLRPRLESTVTFHQPTRRARRRSDQARRVGAAIRQTGRLLARHVTALSLAQHRRWC